MTKTTKEHPHSSERIVAFETVIAFLTKNNNLQILGTLKDSIFNSSDVLNSGSFPIPKEEKVVNNLISALLTFSKLGPSQIWF